jgi:hypothetical protein
MKKYLLLFLLTSGISSAQYITPDTGVTWNLDSLVLYSGGVITGSFPSYILNNTIILSANDQLDIPAGSDISCNQSSSGFEINGIFTVSGTETDPVLFTSVNQDSTGAYDGIQFNAASGTSGLVQYAKIEYASYGIRCIDGGPTIVNSHIFKCDRGIQLSGSGAVIQYNTIERSYEYGILINLDSNPLIENNIIANNNTQNTGAKNQISIGLQGNNSPVIRHNQIYGGSSTVTGGISLWVSGSTNYSNMICEGNIIHDNSFGITLYSTSSGIINAVIKDNEIYDNNLNPNALVSGSGINVNGSTFNTPVITGNKIYGNWWGITIQNGTTVQPGPDPNIGNIENSDTTDDGLNIIHDNIQGSDVYDLYNNCTNDIMAQNNDWGVYDSTLIEDHIFHKVDDPALGLVVYIPFSQEIPVELTGFMAALNGSKVELKWTTVTETNNRGFNVQRSEVGGQRSEWETIGFAGGYGTTTEIHKYSFVDKNVEPVIYAYRLKQMDLDGSYNYSNVVEVEVNSPLEFSLDQNYPNPFNPSTIITYSTAEKSLVTLDVYNALGEKVAGLVNEILPAGSHNVEFNGTGLTSGVYFYTLKIKGNSLTRKMLLIK